MQAADRKQHLLRRLSLRLGKSRLLQREYLEVLPWYSVGAEHGNFDKALNIHNFYDKIKSYQ